MAETFVAANADGTTWFANNSAREPNEAQLIEQLPQRRKRSEPLAVTHMEIEDAGAMEVVLSRPAWMWGAEMGINRAGVVVIAQPTAASTMPLQQVGLIGTDLVRLALEQASSARAAAELIVALLDRYGQGGRMAYGDDVRSSATLMVADASQRLMVTTTGRTATVAAGVAANGPTTLTAIMATLRSQSDVHTTASLIIHLDPDRAPQLWATGTSSPTMSVFKPVPFGGEPWQLQRPADERPDQESLFWRHERLHRQVMATQWTADLEQRRFAFEAMALSNNDANATWEEHRRLLPAWLALVPSGRHRWWSSTGRYWRRQNAALGWSA
jgi:dipeptidase